MCRFYYLNQNLMSGKLTLFSIFLFFMSCKDGTKIKADFSPSVSNKPQPQLQSPPLAGGSPAPRPSPTVGGASNAFANDPSSGGQITDPIEYPTLTFAGNGDLSNDGDHYGVTQDVTAEMSRNLLDVNITRFNSDKSEVNEKVQSQTGESKYARLSQIEFDTWASKIPAIKDATFMILSQQITGRDGQIIQLSQPLPVYIIPASKSQYAILKTKSISFTAVASGAYTGNIDVTLSNGPATGDNFVAVTYSMRLREAEGAGPNRGAEYKKVALPYSATYTIDVEKQQIMQIQSQSLFYSDNSNNTESINVTYRLCSNKQGGRTESFSCGR